jgi:hypothetical protein
MQRRAAMLQENVCRFTLRLLLTSIITVVFVFAQRTKNGYEIVAIIVGDSGDN